MVKKSHVLPKIEYEIELRDRNGKLILKKKEEMHSWLKTFLQMIKGWFYTTRGSSVSVSAYVVSDRNNESILDTGGTSRGFPSNLGDICGKAEAGDSNYGIIVGSDDTPNTLDQYYLNAPIPDGTDVGQLSYGATTVESVTNPSDSIWQFRVIRTFTNNSGTDVVVKEHGLVVHARTYKSTYPQEWAYICLIREVMSSPVTIPDGATLTLRYIFQITVS